MDPSAITTPMMIIAMLLIVLIIVFMTSMYALKMRMESEERIANARHTIDDRRADRQRIARSLLDTFGEETKSDDRFKRLIEDYTSVSSEEEEKRWEGVYIPAMQSFMARASRHAAPTMTNAVAIANKTLVDNENALDAARDELMSAFEQRSRLDRPPLSLILLVADKLVAGIKAGGDLTKRGQDIYAKMKADRQELYRQAGLTNVPSGTTDMTATNPASGQQPAPSDNKNSSIAISFDETTSETTNPHNRTSTAAPRQSQPRQRPQSASPRQSTTPSSASQQPRQTAFHNSTSQRQASSTRQPTVPPKTFTQRDTISMPIKRND